MAEPISDDSISLYINRRGRLVGPITVHEIEGMAARIKKDAVEIAALRASADAHMLAIGRHEARIRALEAELARRNFEFVTRGNAHAADIAALRARMEWRPIETAPRDGTPLLLFCPGANSWNRLDGMPDILVGLWTASSSFRSDHGWYSDVGDVDQGYESTGAYFEHEKVYPTHWQPLPTPPAPEGETP